MLRGSGIGISSCFDREGTGRRAGDDLLSLSGVVALVPSFLLCQSRSGVLFRSEGWSEVRSVEVDCWRVRGLSSGDTIGG